MVTAYPSMDIFQQRQSLSREDAPLEHAIVALSVQLLVDDPVRLGAASEAPSLSLVSWEFPVHEPLQEGDPPIPLSICIWRVVGVLPLRGVGPGDKVGSDVGVGRNVGVGTFTGVRYDGRIHPSHVGGRSAARPGFRPESETGSDTRANLFT